MAKHAPQEPDVSMPPPLTMPVETEIQMTPNESQAVAMVTNVTGNASSTKPQTRQAIFNVSTQTFPPLSPLPVPIVPKGTVLPHPERHILRVKGQVCARKTTCTRKMTSMSWLNAWNFSISAQAYQKPSKQAALHGVFMAAAAIPGGSKAYLCESVDGR